MRLKVVTLIVIAGALGIVNLNLGAPAHAQENDDSASQTVTTKSATGGPVKAKKQTKIDFEDELVEGELKKPELFYLLQKKQFNFKRLIKLREDFLPEMRRDGDEVRRSRSK